MLPTTQKKRIPIRMISAAQRDTVSRNARAYAQTATTVACEPRLALRALIAWARTRNALSCSAARDHEQSGEQHGVLGLDAVAKRLRISCIRCAR